MEISACKPGMGVIWRKAYRGGYGFVTSITGRVLAVSAKRVRIEVRTTTGAESVSVTPAALEPWPAPTTSETAQMCAATEARRNDEIARCLKTIANVLAPYRFTANNEAELQDAVARIFEFHTQTGLRVSREVRAASGRYDILLEDDPLSGPSQQIKIVLELKVKGSAAAVERQAQRYAMTPGISAVVVVTTSQRLALQLPAPDGGTLGGKPFRVIALRTTV